MNSPIGLPDTNVLFALVNNDHAAHGGRLVTLDTKIEAALRPHDRKHLTLLTPELL